jgi:hypothetical protein
MHLREEFDHVIKAPVCSIEHPLPWMETPSAEAQKACATPTPSEPPFANTVLPLHHIAKPRSKDPNESSRIARKWQSGNS